MTFLAMLPRLAVVSEWLGRAGWLNMAMLLCNGLSSMAWLNFYPSGGLWSQLLHRKVGASQQQKLQALLEAVTQNLCPPHHVISTMYYWSKPVKGPSHIQRMDK